MRILSGLAIVFCLAACNGGSADSASNDPGPMHLIGEVQGESDTSPFVGETVTVRGVVTGDFQDNDANNQRNLGGFFITGAPDGSPETSDGIFVFDGDTKSPDVNPGDTVEVSAAVAEFFGETQLLPLSVSIIGSDTVTPAPIEGPFQTLQNSDAEPIANLEAYEGMLVTFADTLTVSELFNIERFGEILLSIDGRLMQYTNANAPSIAGYAEHLTDIAGRSILLDDGRRGQNERPAIYVDPESPVRVGDQVANVTGVLRYSRGSGGSGQQAFRLMPTSNVDFEHVNPRSDAPDRSGGLRVAGFNMLNYFTTPDTGAERCGPSGDAGCRGADSASEFKRQQQKLVAALRAIDADIVGLVELENTADASLRAIVDAMNATGASYSYVNTGTIGDDAIKVGLIYKPSVVSETGRFAILDQSVDTRFIDSKNRPVLAQTFTTKTGGTLTVAVNHLKSKGSDCDELGDPDRRDGQGDCNLTRTRAAVAMADWLNTDPTGSNDDDILIVGDLNAYHREDPVSAVTDRGFANLLDTKQNTDGYSFVFRGQSGALDHAFASKSLAPQVVRAIEWHINADETRLFDYNEEFNRPDDWFDGSIPYRSSDHDPLIVDLNVEP